MTPSGIKPTVNQPIEVEQVRPGGYVVTNAYDGTFQFFDHPNQPRDDRQIR